MDTKERDSRLLAQAQSGSEEAMEDLLEAYKPLVLSRAANYRLEGQDRDDLIQEGMIALFQAIHKCPPERRQSFSAYAFQTVNNRMIDLLRQDQSQRAQAFNQAVSLDAGANRENRDSALTLEDRVASEQVGPEEQIFLKEFEKRLYTWIGQELSEREREVLLAYLSGLSYKELSEDLGLSEKSVDAALQRARGKLRKLRQEEGLAIDQ